MLFTGGERVLIQGYGTQARKHAQYMREYGTNVVAGVAPGSGGERIDGIELFETVHEAVQSTGASVSTIFVRGDAVLQPAIEAIEAGVSLVHIPAEGVPYRDVSIILSTAEAAGVGIVGPNSQGLVVPGRAKLGGSGGDRPERMFMAGPVGVVSRSGGMGGELCWQLTRAGVGQSKYISTGGDLLVGTPLHVAALGLQDDPRTLVIVVFGEAGSDYEERMADLMCEGEINKPVVAFIPGDFLEAQPTGTSFGHAGALISPDNGSPSVKRKRLREAGAIVADRFDEIPKLVAEVLNRPI